VCNTDVPSDIYTIDRSKDNAFYYRIPIVRDFFEWRLKAATRLISDDCTGEVLDVGYGSGFLFPYLQSRFERLHGTDWHTHGKMVCDYYAGNGIHIHLTRSDISSLAYRDNSFDAVVCLSLLEHISEIDRAVGEIYRVLKPRGQAIIGFPPRTILTSALFDLIGFDHKRLHPMGHTEIYNALSRIFTMDTSRFLPRIGSLYILWRCVKGGE
jgi:2-polyprenyl-3-methyl-5-hydroxy-6-metoxy-1,4-benzoquinol methylase